MHSKETIFEHLQEILGELFEIEASEVKADARLYEDLDIDSIDAVDMVVKLKTLTGNKRLEPSDFKNVRTVQDVVDAVYDLLNREDEEASTEQESA